MTEVLLLFIASSLFLGSSLMHWHYFVNRGFFWSTHIECHRDCWSNRCIQPVVYHLTYWRMVWVLHMRRLSTLSRAWSRSFRASARARPPILSGISSGWCSDGWILDVEMHLVLELLLTWSIVWSICHLDYLLGFLLLDQLPAKFHLSAECRYLWVSLFLLHLVTALVNFHSIFHVLFFVHHVLVGDLSFWSTDASRLVLHDPV